MSGRRFKPKNKKVGAGKQIVKNASGNVSFAKKNNFLKVESKKSLKSEKFLVEASPPIGDVPDPNNVGNVIICHFTDPGYVTLSVPIGNIGEYANNPNDYDGACVSPGDDLPVYCPPGSAPDCNGVCNGPSILDCNENCYNPLTTPAAYLRDCAGVCYDVSVGAPNVPDCNGVCGGTSYPDCNGVCDGQAIVDCAGVCGGNAFVDCGGNCNNCQTTVTSGNKVQERKAQLEPAPQNVQKQGLKMKTKLKSQKRVQKSISSKPSTQTQTQVQVQNDSMSESHRKIIENRKEAERIRNERLYKKQNFMKTEGPKFERQPDHLLDKFRTAEFKSTNPNSPVALRSQNVQKGPITDPEERAKILHRPRPKKSNSHRPHRQIATGPQYATNGPINLTNERVRVR